MRTCPLCNCASVKDDGTCFHCAKPVLASRTSSKWNQEPAASQARVAARSEREPEGKPLTVEQKRIMMAQEAAESRAEIMRLRKLGEETKRSLREV